MISGHATPEGTGRFAENSGVELSNYKKFKDLLLSNVGIGTYLGEADARTDGMVTGAVKQSIQSGINVIDTAINYRSQKAERSVGRAITQLIEDDKISRDEVFLCSKNGYVTNDADVQLGFWEYVKKEYSEKGAIKEGDITSSYHCMTPAYLSDQLDRSLNNLNVQCLDLMYLHNGTEGQLKDVPKETFLKNLESVFELYEQKRDEKKIRYYGMATWECFRVAQNDPQYLSLEETIHIAEKVAGSNHGFRFIQLPFNMHYDQALLAKNQTHQGAQVSILESAARLGIGVFTSVPFMQGRLLTQGTMPEFGDLGPSLRALQFIRSCPGVLAPLVGQKTAEHVTENLEIMKIPQMPEGEFLTLLKRLTA